jgi:O-antigen/teichoic acid export membrane protein
VFNSPVVRHRIAAMSRALRTEAVFAASMTAATLLGFLKIAALAWLLSPADLGLYLTGLGVAAALGVAMTFGEVERTYTLYPTYVAQGGTASILGDVIWMTKRLCFRFAVVAGVATIIAQFANLGWLTWVNVMIITILGLGTLLQSLLASIARAIDARKLLPIVNFLRGGTTLIAAITAYGAGVEWKGILAIEGGALCTFFLIFIWYFKRHYGAIGDASLAQPQDRLAKRGQKIWIAALITSAIPSGGRTAVLLLSGAATAGAFGVLMVVVQSGQMVAGALSQKMAASLVRDEVRPHERVGFLKTFAPPVLFLWILALGVFVICASSFAVPTGRIFWDKYGIGLPHLALAALQIGSSIYLMLHFAFMAKAKEEDLLKAGVLAVSVFFSGLWLAGVFDLGLTGYLLASLCADVAHTIFLLGRYVGLLRPRSKNDIR